MSCNRRTRELLEELYDKGCMFKKAKIAEKIEAMGGIKTYKKYIKEKRYTVKDVEIYESRLSYHHLIHRENGGKTTVENGAIINSLAHSYIHSLPREQEERINNMLRRYKKSIECNVEYVDDIETGFEISTMFFEVEKKKEKHKYNRAKEKDKLRKNKEER